MQRPVDEHQLLLLADPLLPHRHACYRFVGGAVKIARIKVWLVKDKFEFCGLPGAETFDFPSRREAREYAKTCDVYYPKDAPHRVIRAEIREIAQ